MMMELLMALLEAGTKTEKERAYHRLERVGIDRITADSMAAEFYTVQEASAND